MFYTTFLVLDQVDGVVNSNNFTPHLKEWALFRRVESWF
jgi:hypothetical protein